MCLCKVYIMRWMGNSREQTSTVIVPSVAPACDGRDECGIKAPSIGISMKVAGPMHPQYVSETTRLQSFSDWPRCIGQKPEELSEAGFFYTGHGDKTKCFYCDGGLKDWESGDVPWEEHARWFDQCAYIHLVKGRDYVQNVLSKTCGVIRVPKGKNELSAAAPSVFDRCKISKIPNIILDLK